MRVERKAQAPSLGFIGEAGCAGTGVLLPFCPLSMLLKRAAQIGLLIPKISAWGRSDPLSAAMATVPRWPCVCDVLTLMAYGTKTVGGLGGNCLLSRGHTAKKQKQMAAIVRMHIAKRFFKNRQSFRAVPHEPKNIKMDHLKE